MKRKATLGLDCADTQIMIKPAKGNKMKKSPAAKKRAMQSKRCGLKVFFTTCGLVAGLVLPAKAGILMTPGGGAPTDANLIAKNDTTSYASRSWNRVPPDTGTNHSTVGQTFYVGGTQELVLTTLWLKADVAPNNAIVGLGGRPLILVIEEFTDANDTEPDRVVKSIPGAIRTGVTPTNGWWCFDITAETVKVQPDKYYGFSLDWLCGPLTNLVVNWCEGTANPYANGKAIMGIAGADGSSFPIWNDTANCDLLFYVHGVPGNNIIVQPGGGTPSATNVIAKLDTTYNNGRVWGYQPPGNGGYRRTIGQSFLVATTNEDKMITTVWLKALSVGSCVTNRSFSLVIEEFTDVDDTIPARVIKTIPGKMPASGIITGWWKFDIASQNVKLEADCFYGFRLEWTLGPRSNQWITWCELTGNPLVNGREIYGQASDDGETFPVWQTTTADLLFYVHGTNTTTIYVDPTYSGTPRNGTLAKPYNSWNEIGTNQWWFLLQANVTYLQKRGTTASANVRFCGVDNVHLGVYGTGADPAYLDCQDTLTSGVSAYTCRNTRVSGFDIRGAVNAGIYLQGCENYVVHHNVCHDSGFGITINAGVFGPCGDITLNTIYNTSGDGIGAWNMCPGAIITYNNISAHGDDGIDILGSYYAVVEGNTVIGSYGLTGIRSGSGIKSGGNVDHLTTTNGITGHAGAFNRIAGNTCSGHYYYGIFNRNGRYNEYVGNNCFSNGVNYNLVATAYPSMPTVYNNRSADATWEAGMCYDMFIPPADEITYADFNVWVDATIHILGVLPYYFTNVAPYQAAMSPWEQNTTFDP